MTEPEEWLDQKTDDDPGDLSASSQVEAQARELVRESRVKLWASSWRGVTADVVGRNGVYRVGWDREGGWVCNCPATTTCSHVVAVSFVYDPMEEQVVTPHDPNDPERPFTFEATATEDTTVPTVPPEEGYEEARLAHDADSPPEVVDTDTTVDVATGEVVHVPMARADMDLANAPVTWRTLEAIADTDMVNQSFRKKPYAMYAAILYGRELGIGPMQSLNQITVIDGSAVPSAQLQLARYFAAGHTLEVLRNDQGAVALKGTRAGGGTTIEVVYQLEDAVAAGLVEVDGDGKPRKRSRQGKVMPWEAYTTDLLWARAVTRLVRHLAPDVLGRQ